MVAIEEVIDDEPKPSEERLLDAQEVESLAKSAQRPTVRLQLEALATKLRKESDALRRVEESKAKAESAPTEEATPTSVPVPAREPASAPTVSPGVRYTPIDRFSFDAGGSSAPFVTLYVPLPRVGSLPRDQITCEFTASTLDLVVQHTDKAYRLCKDHLEHEIVPDKSKIVVKADEIRIKLAKKKNDYGSYDYWSKLVDPKKKQTKADPQASIMELMKNMYDEGDDQMRKVIGETMMKQQRGELGKGGAGGLGDMDDMM